MFVNKNRLIALALQNLALLVIGAILVIGFWYHGNFYQIYFPILVLIGGIVIFLMIKTIAFLWKEREFVSDSKGVILFDPGQKENVVSGDITQVFFKGDNDTYWKDKQYDAKMNLTSKKSFAKLLVTDVEHKELAKINDLDLLKAGSSSFKQFKKDWKAKHGSYSKNDTVTIVRFKLVGGK